MSFVSIGIIIYVFIFLSRNEGGREVIEKGAIEAYNSVMSLKTVIGLILVLLILLGLSELFGILREKRATSTSYLEESVRSTKKVMQLKEERKELIKKQEETLLEPED